MKEYAPQHPILPLPDESEIPAEDLVGAIAFQDLLKNAPNTPVCRVNDMENELALLQYTGGTSGLPKGAMISHHSLSLAVLGANNWFSMSASDSCLGVTPFFHIMGMIQVMCSPLSSGAELVVLTPGYQNKINEKEVFDWCKENMAAYKCPLQVTFLETLPKSAAGKELRRLLK